MLHSFSLHLNTDCSAITTFRYKESLSQQHIKHFPCQLKGLRAYCSSYPLGSFSPPQFDIFSILIAEKNPLKEHLPSGSTVPSTSPFNPVLTIHGSKPMRPIWTRRKSSLGCHFHIPSSKTCRHILAVTGRHTILWHGTAWARGWGCVCACGRSTHMDSSPISRAVSHWQAEEILAPDQLAHPRGHGDVLRQAGRCWSSHSLVSWCFFFQRFSPFICCHVVHSGSFASTCQRARALQNTACVWPAAVEGISCNDRVSLSGSWQTLHPTEFPDTGQIALRAFFLSSSWYANILNTFLGCPSQTHTGYLCVKCSHLELFS